MRADHIAAIRTTALGLTGLCCIGYAGLALWLDRPDPVDWYVPGAVGIGAAVIITLAFVMAGRAEGRRAKDDLYKHVTARAERQAYWLSLALFVAMAVACAVGGVSWNTGFAAFGCLMGASFLLLFVWHDLRMR